MDFKEYLRTQDKFRLSKLAFLMWPKNATAPHYLSKKLNSISGLEFTANDEKRARKALKKLSVELEEDSKIKSVSPPTEK